MRFVLNPARGGVAVKVTAIEQIDEGKTDAGTVTLEGRLAASDRQLNGAYQELIAVLDEAAVKKLRTEQRAWLKERDAIKDSESRLQFIDERVRALLERRRGAKR